MSDAAAERLSASGAWASLGSFMACPDCVQPLRAISPSQPLLDCLHCGSSYPVIASGEMQLPWLFTNPRGALGDWQARLRGFRELSLRAVTAIERSLADAALPAATRERLERLSAAHTEQRRQVDELLAPLALDRAGDDGAPPVGLEAQVASSQGVDSYYGNIFRDWAWGDTENRLLVDIVVDLFERAARANPGELLVIGGGACRLPYDLHLKLKPERTTVLDINPLLLLTAARLVQGQTVELTEFPLAPLSLAQVAIPHTLSAEALPDVAPPERFRLIFGDASRLPFLPGRFDTVLTPWLVDIIAEDFATFAPRMNQALGVGGVWINTGSLAFFHRDPARRYTPEEALALVEAAGFDVLQVGREPIPYLRSPASAQARHETVFSFVARKRHDVPAPPAHRVLPEWLTDTQQPVPELTGAATDASQHLLQAHVLGAVDGKRSVDEIGRLLAAHHDVSIAAATAAVRRILIEQADPANSLPG
ncbi:MAG: hypothetical protein AAFX58_02745 [Pseudomonadota bacterium]